jgi:hypothetical protein
MPSQVFLFFCLWVFTFGSGNLTVNKTELSRNISSIHQISGNFNEQLYEMLKKESTIETLLRAKESHKGKLISDLKEIFKDNEILFSDNSSEKDLEKSTERMRNNLSKTENIPEFIHELANYYTLVKSPKPNQIILKDEKELSREMIRVLREYTNDSSNWKVEDHDTIVDLNDLCKISPIILVIIAISIFAILILGAVGFYFLLRRVNAERAKGEQHIQNSNKKTNNV